MAASCASPVATAGNRAKSSGCDDRRLLALPAGDWGSGCDRLVKEVVRIDAVHCLQFYVPLGGVVLHCNFPVPAQRAVESRFRPSAVARAGGRGEGSCRLFGHDADRVPLHAPVQHVAANAGP